MSRGIINSSFENGPSSNGENIQSERHHHNNENPLRSSSYTSHGIIFRRGNKTFRLVRSDNGTSSQSEQVIIYGQIGLCGKDFKSKKGTGNQFKGRRVTSNFKSVSPNTKGRGQSIDPTSNLNYQINFQNQPKQKINLNLPNQIQNQLSESYPNPTLFNAQQTQNNQMASSLNPLPDAKLNSSFDLQKSNQIGTFQKNNFSNTAHDASDTDSKSNDNLICKLKEGTNPMAMDIVNETPEDNIPKENQLPLNNSNDPNLKMSQEAEIWQQQENPTNLKTIQVNQKFSPPNMNQPKQEPQNQMNYPNSYFAEPNKREELNVSIRTQPLNQTMPLDMNEKNAFPQNISKSVIVDANIPVKDSNIQRKNMTQFAISPIQTGMDKNDTNSFANFRRPSTQINNSYIQRYNSFGNEYSLLQGNSNQQKIQRKSYPNYFSRSNTSFNGFGGNDLRRNQSDIYEYKPFGKNMLSVDERLLKEELKEIQQNANQKSQDAVLDTNSDPETKKYNESRMFSFLSLGFGAGAMWLGYYYIFKSSSSIMNKIKSFLNLSWINKPFCLIKNILTSFGSFLKYSFSSLYNTIFGNQFFGGLFSGISMGVKGFFSYTMKYLIIIGFATAILYLIYRNIKKEKISHQIIKEIKEDFIKESQQNLIPITGISEEKIVGTYSEKYGYSQESFRKSILPKLRTIGKKDPYINLFISKINGKNEIIWQYNIMD